MGAIKPALASLDRSEYLAVRFGLLRTLVTRQLMLGQSAVVDDVVSESQVAPWLETAASLRGAAVLRRMHLLRRGGPPRPD